MAADPIGSRPSQKWYIRILYALIYRVQAVNSNFVTSNNPFFKRGGNYNNGSNAGLFNFNNNDGGANENKSFRSVLWGALWYTKKSKGF